MALRDVRVRADALSGVWQTTSLDTLILMGGWRAAPQGEF